MYCPYCGSSVDDGTVFCPSCGASLKEGSSQTQQQYRADPNDSGSIGWAILGFLIPLVGLILWIVWMHDRPKSAKMAGIGALVSVILSFVLTFLIVALVIAFGTSETPDILLQFL